MATVKRIGQIDRVALDNTDVLILVRIAPHDEIERLSGARDAAVSDYVKAIVAKGKAAAGAEKWAELIAEAEAAAEKNGDASPVGVAITAAVCAGVMVNFAGDPAIAAADTQIVNALAAGHDNITDDKGAAVPFPSTDAANFYRQNFGSNFTSAVARECLRANALTPAQKKTSASTSPPAPTSAPVTGSAALAMPDDAPSIAAPGSAS